MANIFTRFILKASEIFVRKKKNEESMYSDDADYSTLSDASGSGDNDLELKNQDNLEKKPIGLFRRLLNFFVPNKITKSTSADLDTIYEDVTFGISQDNKKNNLNKAVKNNVKPTKLSQQEIDQLYAKPNKIKGKSKDLVYADLDVDWLNQNKKGLNTNQKIEKKRFSELKVDVEKTKNITNKMKLYNAEAKKNIMKSYEKINEKGKEKLVDVLFNAHKRNDAPHSSLLHNTQSFVYDMFREERQKFFQSAKKLNFEEDYLNIVFTDLVRDVVREDKNKNNATSKDPQQINNNYKNHEEKPKPHVFKSSNDDIYVNIDSNNVKLRPNVFAKEDDAYVNHKAIMEWKKQNQQNNADFFDSTTEEGEYVNNKFVKKMHDRVKNQKPKDDGMSI